PKTKSQNAGKRGPTHRFPAKSNTCSRPVLLVFQVNPHSSRTTRKVIDRNATAERVVEHLHRLIAKNPEKEHMFYWANCSAVIALCR
ncbi:hypothetical protein P0R31_33920, partial [Bradyrhizobium yuanmingense]|uniref:hypothetical protein n=1 Tax=Bradyrhizobium yuanmingense TaxID=108015 RepID=UPI0023B9CB33